MPNPSNSDLVGEAKRLSEAATPGPWEAADTEEGWTVFWPRPDSATVHTITGDLPPLAHDARFIARARTLLPELAQQLEQAKQREKTLLRWCEEDGGAVKGYICHADLRYLFALTPDDGAEG